MLEKLIYLGGKLVYLAKNKINQNSRLWKILESTYKIIPANIRPNTSSSINFIISSYSQLMNDIFFIQIGSNDGITGDPIHLHIKRDKWSGILIEPVNYLFKQLLENYEGQKNLIFENVAISNKNELKEFYYFKETTDNLPYWYNQIGSFLSDRVTKAQAKIPNIEDYMIVEKVKCMTFSALLEKYNVKKIDLLHIDTEGYDYEIIKSIDFSQIKPRMIYYEHWCLSNSDIEECSKYLEDKGYRLIQEYADTLAIVDVSVSKITSLRHCLARLHRKTLC